MKKSVKSKVSLWDKIAKRLHGSDGAPADVVVVFGLSQLEEGEGWELRWETQSWLKDFDLEGSLPKGVGKMIIGAVREQLGDELVSKISRAVEPELVRAAGQVGGALVSRIGGALERALDGSFKGR